MFYIYIFYSLLYLSFNMECETCKVNIVELEDQCLKVIQQYLIRLL